MSTFVKYLLKFLEFPSSPQPIRITTQVQNLTAHHTLKVFLPVLSKLSSP
jgi:hypothetical protein